MAARVPAHAAGSCEDEEPRSRRHRSSRLARMADTKATTSPTTRGLVACRVYKHAAGAAHVGRHHVLDLRLRRARLHAHRSRQRDEQQLVVREHPRHQPLRRAAAAAVRLVPARLGQSDEVRASIRSRDHAYFDWDEFREVVRVFTRMLDNVVEINGLPLARAARRDPAQAPSRHGLPRPGFRRSRCSA